MNRITAMFIVAPLLLVTVHAQGAREAGLCIAMGTNSALWLEGDSTLHRYESKATVINLDTEVVLKPDGEAVPAAQTLCGTNRAPSLSKLVLTVPVKEMKSGIAGLAGQMHKALKAKDHPHIVFTMTDYRVSAAAAETNQFDIAMDGSLALAGGVSNIAVVMKGTVDNMALKVKGEKDLLMSSFGVTPPTLFFGAIKTADKVVIKWDLDLTLTSTGRSDKMQSSREP